MAIRLRQLALATDALDAVTTQICTVFGVDHAYHDPGVGKYGLNNSVIPLGETLLEAVCPREPDTAASRFLARRGGDGGYMVILQVDDVDAARSRIERVGARIVDKADLPRATFTHIHPKDVGGAILSVDTMTPPEHWEWGGPDWPSRARGESEPTGIVRAEVAGADPARLAARWAEVIGAPVEENGDRWSMPLEGGTIDFVAAGDDPEGLPGFDIAARDPGRILAAAQQIGLPPAPGGFMLGGMTVRPVSG